MKKVLRIDKQGFYIEDVILHDTELIQDDCVETHCPEGFYKPKWNGKEWVEGLTPEEIEEIQNKAEKNPSQYELLLKENLNLKLALAEMAEEKDSQILEIQLALAEIVEGGLI